ncbi:MAG: hypothetical protein JW757_11320 [Anaerolineales bacterium]|nr:hypothetical protein [Anaerolineales bacterium]
MKRIVLFGLLLVFLMAVAAGCNLPRTSAGEDSGQAAQTYAAQTIEARLTANAVNSGDGGQVQPTNTQAPPPPEEPTDTPEPTETPKPTLTPTKEKPCNQAEFVKDVTVPDGEEHAPGDTFTKTWRLKNVGSCTWNNDYDLVFDSGEKMGASNVEDINMGNVAPGDTVDVSVDLTAPAAPGTYRGRWKLRSADGVVFALGDDDVSFFVEIEVVEAVSIDILGSNVYSCGMDTYVAVRVKNTGTKALESSKSSVKNLDTNATTDYLPYDKPFTENANDCPPMQINNLEPGDVYYVTFNMASSSAEFKFTVRLCTQEGGGGDCASDTITVDVP